MTKLFLESEFHHKGNTQIEKNVNSKPNFAVFSAAIEHKISSNASQKRTKQNLVQFSFLGQEPTLKHPKVVVVHIDFVIIHLFLS